MKITNGLLVVGMIVYLLAISACAKNKTKFDAHVDYEHDVYEDEGN